MSIRASLLPPVRTPTRRRSINDVLSAGLARVFVTPRKCKSSTPTALHAFQAAFESVSVGSPLGDEDTDEAKLVADLMHVLNQTLPDGEHLEGGVDRLTQQTNNIGNAAANQQRAEEIAKRINEYVTYMINANLTVDQVSRQLSALASSLGLKLEFVRHWVFQVNRDRAAQRSQAARQAVVADHTLQPPPSITPLARSAIHDYVQSKRGGQRHDANVMRDEILDLATQLQLPVRTVEYWIRANLVQP